MGFENLKIREDKLPNAQGILDDVDALMCAAFATSKLLLPYSKFLQDEIAKEQLPGVKTIPQYLVATRKKLQDTALDKFAINYPHIQGIIANGAGGKEEMQRLHDAIYLLSDLNKKLSKAGYLVKTDVERDSLSALAAKIAGNLSAFIIMQYELYKETSSPLLSVATVTSHMNITPEVYYGELLRIMESTGTEFYAYEPASNFYSAMDSVDSAFVGECADAEFPLTDSFCQQILDGELSLAQARTKLQEFQKQNTLEIVDEDIHPYDMIKKLHLE